MIPRIYRFELSEERQQLLDFAGKVKTFAKKIHHEEF